MNGLLIILSGPSGVGKGTVRKVLVQDESLNLAYSISMTTRGPRNGEVEGKDYFFVTKEKFLEALQKNELLEHARFVDNYYGTPKDYVQKLREQGKNVILEIETNGAREVIEKTKGDKGVISIFIMPPSFEELRSRIEKRKTEPERIINERLEKAKKSNEALEYKSRILANKAEDAENVARQKIDRLNSKAARLEHELSRKY